MDGAATEVSEVSAMDRVEAAKVERLKAKLDEALRKTAEIEVELSRAEGAIRGVPHYSVIENRAHRLGQTLSQQVQQRQMSELAAAAAPTAKCPHCGKLQELSPRFRELTSVDGPARVQELAGTCCRKFFFPAA